MPYIIVLGEQQKLHIVKHSSRSLSWLLVEAKEFASLAEAEAELKLLSTLADSDSDIGLI
jgi:hypothetical protein